MEKVYITKRGKVFHSDRNCEWMNHTRSNAFVLGRKVHPLQTVKPTEVGRRVECRVCANGGESPKRGK